MSYWLVVFSICLSACQTFPQRADHDTTRVGLKPLLTPAEQQLEDEHQRLWDEMKK